MTTTRTRSRGHTGSRASAARAGAERRPMIISSAVGAVILLAFAALATSIGHVVLAATDHFMLKYSGVFALMLLTGSAMIGVMATDRIILNPGHRVIAQAVHRAFAFGTLAFLVVHIVLEITAPHLEESTTLHVHVLDAFIPFLSQYRTFYMAEGTIASDIIILLVITGILRRRFTTNGNAWKWRAIHYSNYAALILGVLHGLLAGRKAIGTFVYWSYGAVILLLALAVMVRFLATSLRHKEVVAGAAPLADKGGTASSQSMPVRAAALGLMSQMNGAMPLGGATRAVPALQGGNPAMGRPYSAPYAAPVGAPQAIAVPPDLAQAGPGPVGPGQGGRMPRYEPGYDGPPRYEGAPAPRPGDAPPGRWPESGRGTGPQPPYATGPQPIHRTGPQAAYGMGPQATRGTGPQPGYGTGPQPYHRTGPQPAYGTGPQPTQRPGPPAAGLMPDATGRGTGPQPVYPARPPVARTGPQPVYDSGPRPSRDDGYRQGRPYDGDPGYGRPYESYGPDPDDGRGQGYGADPRYEDDGYEPEPRYGPGPRRPWDDYGGPPPGYLASDPRPQPGRRARPQPSAMPPGERTGPLPRVPSYGGDERR